MEKREGFYTLKGYQNGEAHNMTASMEDYLEMICRLLLTEEVVRVNQLAHMLHVKPSSASKMVKNLKGLGYLLSEKYGYIRLTDKGRKAGDYLLFRHDILNRFLKIHEKEKRQNKGPAV